MSPQSDLSGVCKLVGIKLPKRRIVHDIFNTNSKKFLKSINEVNAAPMGDAREVEK